MSLSLKPLLSPHVTAAAASLVAAAAMWAVITASNLIEMQLDVDLRYTDTPPTLMVTSGLVNKAAVRLRGPAALLRSGRTSHQSYPVSLKNLRKGNNVIPLNMGEGMAGVYRAFEIIDVQPSELRITADEMRIRKVSLEAEIPSGLNEFLIVGNTVFNPGVVTLRGPAAVVDRISVLKVPVQIDPGTGPGEGARQVKLNTPSLVTATPATVTLQYVVLSRRVRVERRVRLTLEADVPRNYAVQPEFLDISVEVPESLARNEGYLNRIQAVASAPHSLLERRRDADASRPAERTARVQPRIATPEGMTVLAPSPVPHVTITRLR